MILTTANILARIALVGLTALASKIGGAVGARASGTTGGGEDDIVVNSPVGAGDFSRPPIAGDGVNPSRQVQASDGVLNTRSASSSTAMTVARSPSKLFGIIPQV